jgi:hypothetical protein
MMEYYEEIHKAIDIIRQKDGIQNILLYGQGSGTPTKPLPSPLPIEPIPAGHLVMVLSAYHLPLISLHLPRPI